MNIEQLLENSDWLQRLAWSLVRDPHDADDLVQETWVAALRAESKGGSPVENPRSWLKTVLRNFAHLSFRRRARERARDQAASVAEIEPMAECAMERIESAKLLIEALLRLDASDQEVVVLRYVDGLDSMTIGERIGARPGAVRMKLKRSLDRMRTDLDRRHCDDRSAWTTALLPIAHGGLSGAGAGAASIGTSLWFKAGALLLVVSIAVSSAVVAIVDRSDAPGPVVSVPAVSELQGQVVSLQLELAETRDALAVQSQQLDDLIEILADLASDPTEFSDSV